MTDDGAAEVCDECGREFDSSRALSSHQWQAHDPNNEKPWHDEEVLRELYLEKGLSANRVADRLGVDPSTINDVLEKYGIEKRGPFEGPSRRFHHLYSRPLAFRTQQDGYEVWTSQYEGEQHTIQVHRLAAVAWFGFDAVKNKHVHHEKPIPWLNVEWNLEPMDPREHISQHMKGRAEKMVFDEDGNISGWER